MFRFFVFYIAVVSSAVFSADVALAADQPIYAPLPGWVKPVAIPPVLVDPDAGSVQFVLANIQQDFSGDHDRFFTESVIKIVAPDGLSRLGSFTQPWNPETETLIIHRLNIIRGGQIIDLLAGGKRFTVLRRETNLEAAMLDGTLTATFQPEGLQVGDIVDFALTVERRDPALQGRSQSVAQLAFPGKVGRVYFRSTWPTAKPMQWIAAEGYGAPKVTRSNGQTELLYDLTDAKSPKPPEDAPIRFNDIGLVEVTQFKDWSEVSALMTPLYDKAAALAPGSPLLSEAAKIKAGTADPKARAAAALHLVEEQTRYLFLGMNLGGLVPADADVTWNRRFGDCKGKTVLLLALLHALDIDAQPALVSTGRGDGLDQRLPMMLYFDHVMVRATIGGKVYWLDGTRTGDRGLDDLLTPNFGMVLLVQAKGGALEKLNPARYGHPATEDTLELDSRAGLDKPAPAHAELKYRYDAAIVAHSQLEQLSKSDADRFQRQFWRNNYPWIDITKVASDYDAKLGELTMTMDGSATVDWQHDGDSRDFYMAASSLGWKKSYTRELGPHHDAPYAVNYPDYRAWKVVMQLPAGGAGFQLIGGTDVDQTIAGVHFVRHSTIHDGVMTMDASEESIEPEFPYTEASQAADALAVLNDHDVTVRAGAAYAATLPSADSVSDDQPTNAVDFSLRGLKRLSAGQYEPAIADLSQAVRLEPTVAKHAYNRGVAYFENGQDDLALADFDKALKLRPDDPLALVARGQVHIEQNRGDLASKDFDAALKLGSTNLNIVIDVSTAYERVGLYAEAVKAYDQLATPTAAGASYARILNNRCWLRVEWGQQLEKAQADCDASHSLNPTNPSLLDTQGLLDLRLRRFSQSIADYTAALAGKPDGASSLYGRGLAERSAGQKAAGDADLAAARAIDPAITAKFAAYGLKP